LETVLQQAEGQHEHPVVGEPQVDPVYHSAESGGLENATVEAVEQPAKAIDDISTFGTYDDDFDDDSIFFPVEAYSAPTITRPRAIMSATATITSVNIAHSHATAIRTVAICTTPALNPASNLDIVGAKAVRDGGCPAATATINQSATQGGHQLGTAVSVNEGPNTAEVGAATVASLVPITSGIVPYNSTVCGPDPMIPVPPVSNLQLAQDNFHPQLYAPLQGVAAIEAAAVGSGMKRPTTSPFTGAVMDSDCTAAATPAERKQRRIDTAASADKSAEKLNAGLTPPVGRF
jgi:hypothetical protein